MAQYPFVYSFKDARAYYGPSLTPAAEQQQLGWIDQEQIKPYEEARPLSRAALAVGLAGGLFASGFIPINKGRRLWDIYTPFARAVEEYSPGQIFRTFQVSAFLSQFETKPALSLLPEQLTNNKIYTEYLTRLLGPGTTQWGGQEVSVRQRLLIQGLDVRGGQAFWGGTEDVALKYAGILTTPKDASAYFGSGFARTSGSADIFATRYAGGEIPYAHAFFAQEQPLRWSRGTVNPTIGRMPAQVIGAHSLPQYVGRQAAAWGTEWVSRFNRLLRAPFEMQPFKTVFDTAQAGLRKVTGKQVELAVAEDTGLRMLRNLSVKYGLGLGAIALGYQTVDWMFRNSSVLDKTMFAEGLTAGIGTVGVKANLLASQIAEATGLHRYREFQEEMAPGSTSLQKLAAFPLLGAFGAGIATYLTRVGLQAREQFRGADAVVARETADEIMRSFGGRGLLAQFGREVTTKGGLYSRQDLLGKVMRAIARPTESGDLYFKFLGKIGPTKLASLAGAGLGTAAILPFLGGALVPSTRPDELEAIYSGQQEVPIRKGRWWEFGRTPYEGSRIMYYRPHWYAKAQMRARDKAIWGEEEPSPFEKLWRREFTYELEKKFYRDRPYPITGLPFEDVPLIGPLLANTVGRLIKPPMLMHTEEWISDSGVKAQPPGFGQRIATELGQEPGGYPISPYGVEGAIGEQAYRFTEMIGLPGFSMVSVKEALTGTGDLFDQMKQLESSRRIAGFERYYWDLELGGLLGSTEAFRRLYPHRRRQIPLYNPIRNTMPDWLPGSGEKSPDFLHGDPYTKIREGELRLPGPGYQVRFPELEGVDPEDYPLIHRWKILTDIAPYSDQAKMTGKFVSAARKKKTWTDYEENLYQTIIEQDKQKKESRIDLQDYRYLSPMGEITDEAAHYAGGESSEAIARLNELHAQQREGDKGGLFQRLFGGYWELLAHNAESAWDSMTPISPAAKLVHTRSPIESYERLQVYGTENAFWQHPVRDFFRPFTMLTGRSLGWAGIPGHVERKREIEEYFDVLKYTKYARLANLARSARDKEAVKEFESKKDETLFGINPFTRNYRSIFRSLPRRERDYFNTFAAASTTEERQRILEVVPDNEKALYVARWKLAFADEVKQAEKKGLLSEKQYEEADNIVEGIYKEAKTEGFPSSKELTQEYIETRLPNETYPDWYRRTKLLPEYPTLPGVDWVGWHPSVDLEDVKLKVIHNLGEDMHDFNLWPSRLQDLAYKPYIDDDAIEPIIEPEELTEGQMRGRINELFSANGMIPSVFKRSAHGYSNSIEVNIDRESDPSDPWST